MVQEVGGGDGDRVDLGIREQVTVVFVRALKSEDVESILACVGGGVSGRDEAGCDLKVREMLRDVGVGARVKSSHPTQRDDTDAERLSCCHRLRLATLRGKRASALKTRVTIWCDKL